MQPVEATSPDTDPTTMQADGASSLAALTAFDRCDSAGCAAAAYVRARLRSGLELVFCAHHGHELIPALAGQGASIRDDSHTLIENRAIGV